MTSIKVDLYHIAKVTLKATNEEAKEISVFTRSGDDSIRIAAALRLFGYTCSLKEPGNGYVFRIVGTISVLESLSKFKYKGTDRQRITLFLSENLSSEQKINLLNGFAFSKIRDIFDYPGETRHLMFDDFSTDIDYKKKNYIKRYELEYCGHLLCGCDNWLKKNPLKVDTYFAKLVNNIYSIRCAIVHDAFPVLFLPDYSQKNEYGSFHSSVHDVFPVDYGKKLVRYNASLDPEVFSELIIESIKKYLLGGS